MRRLAWEPTIAPPDYVIGASPSRPSTCEFTLQPGAGPPWGWKPGTHWRPVRALDKGRVRHSRVRDFSRHALILHSKLSGTARQLELSLRMLRKPAASPGRFGCVWKEQVHPLADVYEMNP